MVFDVSGFLFFFFFFSVALYDCIKSRCDGIVMMVWYDIDGKYLQLLELMTGIYIGLMLGDVLFFNDISF